MDRQQDEATGRWDPQHFKSLATLGKGNHATVYLVESSQTKQLYAMKVRSKLLAWSNSDPIGTEKTLLLLASEEKHPFIVNVFGGFQTPSFFILYQEFCHGGDLLHHLQSGGKFSLERARFYAAEVCLALKWLHGMNVLYRNLSLHNLLLGVDGHIKLVDFVVSKLGVSSQSKTKTFCGSAEFMPPEMLLDHPYNSSVDWWQLGIVTYQMLTGQSPFRGQDEDEIYDSILADEPVFPRFMTNWTSTVDFVQCLLQKEPEKRLGSQTKGADQVMGHDFFSGTPWDDLYHKRVAVPFLPKVVDGGRQALAGNLDLKCTPQRMNIAAIIADTETLTPEVQDQFRGFEFSVE